MLSEIQKTQEQPIIDWDTSAEPAEKPAHTYGTMQFNRRTVLVLHVEGSREPMMFRSVQGLRLGRKADKSTAIDLTPFGAIDKGVSRTHAILQVLDDLLTITDLGSSNGTWVNGRRIIVGQRRIVRDGDEIRLGRMVIRVEFATDLEHSESIRTRLTHLLHKTARLGKRTADAQPRKTMVDQERFVIRNGKIYHFKPTSRIESK